MNLLISTNYRKFANPLLLKRRIWQLQYQQCTEMWPQNILYGALVATPYQRLGWILRMKFYFSRIFQYTICSLMFFYSPFGENSHQKRKRRNTAWNQTGFTNGVQRFLNLKKCDRTRIKGFKFWKNLAQTRTQRIVT